MTAFDWSELTAIYTRRTLKVAPLSPGRPERRPSRALVAAAVGNFARAGYSVSPELIQNFLDSDTHSFLTVYRELNALGLSLRGGDADYEPMYPNFPTQVAEADEIELLFNAMFHYSGKVVGLRITPNYSKEERRELQALQDRQFTLGSWDDACSLLTSIMSSTQPFTDADVRDLRAVATDDFDAVVRALPEQFPVRENLVHMTMIMRTGTPGQTDSLGRFYRTATDVLRLAVAMSEGNPNLAEGRVHFSSFKRADRRMLLELIDQSGEVDQLVEDMQRRPEQFKRLAERLHPGDFSRRYRRALDAFNALRNNERVSSYNSQVELLIEHARAAGRVSDELLELVATRPGDFARRLDNLLRLAPDAASRARVVAAFSEVAHQVSVKVLLQLLNFYLNRDNGNARVAIAKGGNKVVLNESAVPFDDNGDTVRLVVSEVGSALRDIFSSRPALGKVWVDPDLASRMIPISVQNASESMEVTGRFTRTSIDKDVSTLRFFIHWKDVKGEEGRYGTDVDLSAMFLGEDFEHRGSVSYQSLRRGGFALHSGDYTSAPNGASEFIDVDIEKALAAGVRYVVQDVRVYSSETFSKIPECYAGYMGRTEPDSGEVFEPSTVKNKATLTAETTTALLYVFDLRERIAVWVDASTNVGFGVNSLTGNLAPVARLAQVAMTNAYLSLHDLFLLHGASRGELVDTREEADTVFGAGGTVEPTDAAKIMSEWM